TFLKPRTRMLYIQILDHKNWDGKTDPDYRQQSSPMAITRIIFVSISIFLLSGCLSESNHQGKEFTSLIKNRALAIEFDKFINSEKVKDLCAKTTHCVIEIAFFPRDGNYYLFLSANQ